MPNAFQEWTQRLKKLRGKVMRFIVSVNYIHRVISCVGSTVDQNLKRSAAPTIPEDENHCQTCGKESVEGVNALVVTIAGGGITCVGMTAPPDEGTDIGLPSVWHLTSFQAV